jgi:hypothetical protein
MTRAVFVLGALLVAGTAGAAEQPPEVLLGVGTDFDAGQVTFVVASTGCTTRADFRCDQKDGKLTLIRERRDACKAMPQRLTITFTLKELGLSPHQPFTLGNRLIVNENLAKP